MSRLSKFTKYQLSECKNKKSRLYKFVIDTLKVHTEIKLANLIKNKKVKIPEWLDYDEGMMNDLTLYDKEEKGDDIDYITLRLEILR